MTRDEILRQVDRAVRESYGAEAGESLMEELERHMPIIISSNFRVVLRMAEGATEADFENAHAVLERFGRGDYDYAILPHDAEITWVEKTPTLRLQTPYIEAVTNGEVNTDVLEDALRRALRQMNGLPDE
jgi:hypothetical protein